MDTVLKELVSRLESGEEAALATIIEVQGASPAHVGFKLLVSGDGTSFGNVGGGELEKRVVEAARESLKTGKPSVVHYVLKEEGEHSIGMLCGGDVKVFIEPFLARPVLLIVGGGHIGRPLAEMGRILGYEVRIVDIRAERGDTSAVDLSHVTRNTHVVIITEDHRTDEEILRRMLETDASYIGMIGSIRKIETIREDLKAQGFSQEALSRLRGPIGLDLGGREPQQISLAILAEIEMLRHGGSGRPRSDAINKG